MGLEILLDCIVYLAENRLCIFNKIGLNDKEQCNKKDPCQCTLKFCGIERQQMK